MKGVLAAIIRLHLGEKDVQLQLGMTDEEFDAYIAHFAQVDNMDSAMFGLDSEDFLYLFGESQISSQSECYVKYSPIDGSPITTCVLPENIRFYARCQAQCGLETAPEVQESGKKARKHETHK